MTRHFILLTHWEAYESMPKILEYIEKMANNTTFQKNQYYLALPYDYLHESKEKLAPLGMILGANDMTSMNSGSFTESVTVKLLKDIEVKFALIGRALMRFYLGEDFPSINNKIKAALASNIQPFLCVGETFQADEEGKASEMVKEQLKESLKDISEESLQKISFIYDTPSVLRKKSEITAQDINQAYDFCKQISKDIWGEQASNLQILCAIPNESVLNQDLIDQTHCSGFYIRK